MRLYVCYGTFSTPRSGGHPCKNAYDALKEAGHDPEVVRSYGWTVLPDALNFMPGRRRAKELTGDTSVPVLELEDGTAIYPSQKIIEWAEKNPAGTAGATQPEPSGAG